MRLAVNAENLEDFLFHWLTPEGNLKPEWYGTTVEGVKNRKHTSYRSELTDVFANFIMDLLKYDDVREPVMSNREWEFLVNHYGGGQTYQEVADAKQVSETTARRITDYAITKLLRAIRFHLRQVAETA